MDTLKFITNALVGWGECMDNNRGRRLVELVVYLDQWQDPTIRTITCYQYDRAADGTGCVNFNFQEIIQKDKVYKKQEMWLRRCEDTPHSQPLRMVWIGKRP
jgi:hypothetical protein